MRFLPLVAALLVQVHGSDYSSLMQSDVISAARASAAGMQGIVASLEGLPFKQPERQFAVSALMRQVRKVEKLDDASRKTLGDVKGLLFGIAADMVADRDQDQAELNAANGMISACNDHWDTEDANAAGAVTTAKSNYDDCKDEEEAAWDEDFDKCGTLILEMTTLHSQTLDCVLPTAYNFASIDTWNSFITAGLAWFTAADAEFQIKEPPCSAAIKALSEKISECEGLQTTYESEFCQWRIERLFQCNHLDTCYQDAVDHYNNASSHVMPLAVERRAEGVAIARIICLIDNLLANPQTFTLDGCENTRTDAALDADYSLVAVTLTDKDTCDRDAVAVYPGAGTWYATYPTNNKAPAVANLISC